MSFKKGIIAGLLAVSFSGLPLLAQADNLHLVNNTDFDTTSRINNEKCSTSIPGGSGVTKAHSTNDVKEMFVVIACKSNRENCVADVFLNGSCSGTKIGTVVIDSKKYEFKTKTMDNPAYDIVPIGKFGFELKPVANFASKK